MRKLLITLILLSGINTPILAVDWVYIGTSNRENINYLDIDSIEPEGSNTYVWYKVIIRDPDNELKKEGVDTIKARLVFNCKEKTYKLMRSISYDEQGRTIWEANDNESFESITPNTVPARIYNHICLNKN